MKRFKTIPGLDAGATKDDLPVPTEIEFEITDNSKVAGLGMPITVKLCRQLISNYFLLQKKIYDLASKYIEDELDEDLKNHFQSPIIIFFQKK